MKRLLAVLFALSAACTEHAYAQAPAASPSSAASPAIAASPAPTKDPIDFNITAWVERDSATAATGATNPGARIGISVPLFSGSRLTTDIDVYAATTCSAPPCSIDLSSLNTFGNAARVVFGYEWQVWGDPTDKVRLYLRGESGFAGGFSGQAANQSWHRYGVGPLLEFCLPGNKHPVKLSGIYGYDDEVGPPATLTLPRQTTFSAWIPALPIASDKADVGLSIESVQNVLLPAGTTLPNVTRVRLLFVYSGQLGASAPASSGQ